MIPTSLSPWVGFIFMHAFLHLTNTYKAPIMFQTLTQDWAFNGKQISSNFCPFGTYTPGTYTPVT